MVLLSSCVPLHFLESLNIVFEHGTSIGITYIILYTCTCTYMCIYNVCIRQV